VRRGPKGTDEGGTGELTKGERNSGTKTARRRRSGRPARTRGRGEREGGDGVLERAREGGPLIGNATRVGDGPWVAPHGGEAWGVWG
jgi:hypothetical protein